MTEQARIALVTGGGRGIGRGASLALAARGLAVAVNFNANADAAQTTVDAIVAAGGRAIPVRGDVSDPAAVQAMVDCVTEQLGPIDVLVNNAAVTTRGTVDLDAWRRVLEVNLTGAFICTQAVLAGMIERGWGRIINVSSTAGVQGAGETHYCASKAGLLGYTMALARHVAAQGVTVNAVSPSLVDTEFHPPSQRFVFQQNAGRLIPVGRLATAEEIGQIIADLIRHPFVTGANLLAAGGVIMG